jgi:hypothetical protein
MIFFFMTFSLNNRKITGFSAYRRRKARGGSQAGERPLARIIALLREMLENCKLTLSRRPQGIGWFTFLLLAGYLCLQWSAPAR